MRVRRSSGSGVERMLRRSTVTISGRPTAADGRPAPETAHPRETTLPRCVARSAPAAGVRASGWRAEVALHRRQRRTDMAVHAMHETAGPCPLSNHSSTKPLITLEIARVEHDAGRVAMPEPHLHLADERPGPLQPSAAMRRSETLQLARLVRGSASTNSMARGYL